MNKQDIIDHVNVDHLDTIKIIYKHYVKNEEIQSIKLLDLDLESLKIEVNNKEFTIPYDKKANNLSEIKYILIGMHQNAQYLIDLEPVQKEYNDFLKQNHRSVYLATQNKEKELLCSSTVLFRKNDDFYVYLAKVAQHYQNIKYNNKNLGVLLIENSQDDKTEFLRNSVQYVADLEEVNNPNLAQELLDELEKNPVEEKVAKMLKKFEGFVLFKIILKTGRAKFGFGKAYDVVNHKLIPIKMEEDHIMKK
ncbi:DUF2470 domain-containing protein [Mycoplasma sp. T363T]|uniref:DUF2470 domain-containing protein n=1 Tax=Mycoplasma bradburyae TaxID=2963128 RepID=A0AAW6HPB4_9MOLU|nr:DUF2470 domain-containing protein [Mycoplasma bradburyae]MDC4163142.1 DUF2470 domain-containing protein [Mycoplasma bradburyae]MDC4182458.1 DUF2470 domain-containing protein [Mycoplasma bradburyae]MDC4183677.1 DUF2470 domain-containing protein [Mycoplasma bradburyae]UTS70928.1 DUF2470 domain-containing protein [Mycoplasma bradburyae]